MYEVAVYSDQQHEQWTCEQDRLVLRENQPGSGCWALLREPAEEVPEDCLCISLEEHTARLKPTPHNVQHADGRVLPNDGLLSLPCVLKVGQTWLEIATTCQQSRKLVPLRETNFESLFSSAASGDQPTGPSAATVTKWLAEAGQLHRAAAGSAQFYADAARFAVETVGLDAAWVLCRTEAGSQNPWRIAGSCLPSPERGLLFDKNLVDQLEGQQVAWYQPTDAGSAPQAVVVAPVLNEAGAMVAAIYGVRHTQGANRRRGIRPLEARLVQLLAESVAVGIARLQQETEAARTRVLLEQAFSPTVAEYIQQHPESLAGQQREVTLMFADLRGYTTLAETMQPTDCYDLLGEVMEVLTEVVVRHRGIVVDYYGDGLLALWNAPLDQPAHADLACGAALEMLETLPAVSQRWQSRLHQPLELGVGIHSGPAYVGNAGTRSRLKYGPRGNTVNVASRVQAASKQLQLPLVITAATQTKLSPDYFTLRVCTAKLPGLEQPAELYTAYPASDAAGLKMRLEDYSRALDLFERGEFDKAEALLEQLTALGQVTPAHFLAHYTAAQKNGNRGRRAIDRYAADHGSVIEILAK